MSSLAIFTPSESAPGMGWPVPTMGALPGPRPLAPLIPAHDNPSKVKPVSNNELVFTLFSPHSPLFRPPWIYVTFAFFTWCAVAFDLLFQWVGSRPRSPYSPPTIYQNTDQPNI